MYYWNYNYTRFQSNQEYDENNQPLYSEISDNQLQDFIHKAQTQNCQIVNGSDNKPMLKPIVLSDEQILMNLRNQREVECFPIINRGKLWYDKLTTEQIAELNKWYNAWLDVTETRIIPTKPSWLI